MKTVNDITESNVTNKMALFIERARELASRANDLADQDSWIEENMRKEVVSAFRKAESADCEYAAYVNAHAAEVWVEKLEGLKNGTLSVADIFSK